jgi:hypothetical protein
VRVSSTQYIGRNDSDAMKKRTSGISDISVSTKDAFEEKEAEASDIS